MRRKTAARLVAIVAGAVTAGLLSIASANAVADGKPASPGQYPFAVKFTMTNIPRPDGSHYNSACSGALISPLWVITAGHCFHDVNRVPVSGPPRYRTTATLGTVNLARWRGETRLIVDVRQSPVDDIALAKLSAPITDIVPLMIDTVAPRLGLHLQLAGWGATSDVNATPGTVLNFGTVAVGQIGTDTIGVHGVYPSPYTSSCLYDSGAPYFIPLGTKAGLLVSVESNGPNCPHNQLETTARVDVISQWIHRQITTR